MRLRTSQAARRGRCSVAPVGAPDTRVTPDRRSTSSRAGFTRRCTERTRQPTGWMCAADPDEGVDPTEPIRRGRRFKNRRLPATRPVTLGLLENGHPDHCDLPAEFCRWRRSAPSSLRAQRWLRSVPAALRHQPLSDPSHDAHVDPRRSKETAPSALRATLASWSPTRRASLRAPLALNKSVRRGCPHSFAAALA